ncbi:MAG: RidA family protein [Actinomycetota bacterium]
MSDMQRFSSGAAWEPIVGYSRAVVAGHWVEVSGSAPPVVDGEIEGGDDPYQQTLACLRVVGAALERAGATFADVIRTRIFVTDIKRWEEFGRAHGEIFGDIRPATSMVEVSALIDPRMLVEVEATAYIGGAR